MESHNVIAEVNISTTKNRVDDAVERLAAYHPAVARSDYGLMEIVITVPAESLERAIQTGVALIGAGTLARVEGMTTATFDKRIGIDRCPS